MVAFVHRHYVDAGVALDMFDRMQWWLEENVGGDAIMYVGPHFEDNHKSHLILPEGYWFLHTSGFVQQNWWMCYYNYRMYGSEPKANQCVYSITACVPDEMTGITMMLSL